METLLEIKTNTEIKPSLLRQIVDEVDMMDDEGKEAVLRKIKMEISLKNAIEIDKELEHCERLIAEDDIADLVSKYRKEQYIKNTIKVSQ